MASNKPYPSVVKFLTDEDGLKENDRSWHYVINTDGYRSLCGGQVFGYGESRVEYVVKGGKITCKKCIEQIKEFKAVRL